MSGLALPNLHFTGTAALIYAIPTCTDLLVQVARIQATTPGLKSTNQGVPPHVMWWKLRGGGCHY